MKMESHHGDLQWWENIRTAVSEESTRNLLETIMEDAEAPSPNDAAPPIDRSGARRRIGKCTEQDRDHDCSISLDRASYSANWSEVIGYVETIMDYDEAPPPNNAAPPWPSAKRQKIDCDSELADVLRKTEIMITDFHEQGYLTLPVGQKVLEMLRNPELDMFDTDMKAPRRKIPSKILKLALNNACSRAKKVITRFSSS